MRIKVDPVKTNAYQAMIQQFVCDSSIPAGSIEAIVAFGSLFFANCEAQNYDPMSILRGIIKNAEQADRIKMRMKDPS